MAGKYEDGSNCFENKNSEEAFREMQSLSEKSFTYKNGQQGSNKNTKIGKLKGLVETNFTPVEKNEIPPNPRTQFRPAGGI